MGFWRPQRFKRIHQGQVPPDVLQNALATGEQIVNVHASLPPIFSLRHLAHHTETEYGFLRAVVSRKIDAYTVFRVSKADRGERSDEFRIICVPSPSLMKVQRWLLKHVLSCGRSHTASFAYTKGTGIREMAELHCGCRWLLKLDVRRFFESISEISVYRVFRGFGYQPLVALEMARLCTRLRRRYTRGSARRWYNVPMRYSTIAPYNSDVLGHLPQGAPTSPALSNLTVVDLDDAIASIAEKHALVYTRYADDICLSSRGELHRRAAASVIGEVYQAMSCAGLSPNITKTRIVPPGARKVVLGLVVDGDRPRLPREFRDRLRQHLYYLVHPNVGPTAHAMRRGFASTAGLRSHLAGLISFAKQIDPAFGEKCEQQFLQIAWAI